MYIYIYINVCIYIPIYNNIQNIFSATSTDLAVLPLDHWPCWRFPGATKCRSELRARAGEISGQTIARIGGFLKWWIPKPYLVAHPT